MTAEAIAKALGGRRAGAGWMMIAWDNLRSRNDYRSRGRGGYLVVLNVATEMQRWFIGYDIACGGAP